MYKAEKEHIPAYWKVKGVQCSKFGRQSSEFKVKGKNNDIKWSGLWEIKCIGASVPDFSER